MTSPAMWISFLPAPARIVAVAEESPDTRSFVVELDGGAAWPAPLPGQFVMLSIAGEGEAAFTVSSWAPPGSPIRQLCLTIRRVGRLTGALFRLGPGSTVGLRGPYGRGFPEWPATASLLFVAGGCGLAPLRAAIEARLAQRAAAAPLAIVYGAREPASRILLRDLERWRTLPGVTLLEPVEHADSGWTGRLGTVVGATDDALAAGTPDFVALCGPPRMLAAVARHVRAAGVPAARVCAAVERQMKCAVGLCGRCWIGHRYACTEGPVFSLDELAVLDPAPFAEPQRSRPAAPTATTGGSR
ncbi:FAD-binding oxidoreductase [Reyranella sp.]|uniref:iron-sulfur cluster-binding protein n=1 Tax=Reyranella sp. TaxID=1929291 RepID=UPI003BA948BE